VIPVHLVRCAVAALALSGVACGDSHILVGSDRSCVDAAGGVGPSGDAALTKLVFWQNGFENGFTAWGLPANEGFCYPLVPVGGASLMTVTSRPDAGPQGPVHSGQYAAAFTINTDVASASQTRCVRQGVLPPSAYYGAYYYVPATATNNGNWNLLHFQGSNVANGSCVLELWDVSLNNDADGGLTTSVYDFLRQRLLPAGPAIPIGQWFHLEVFLQRAADDTGRFTLYQDGIAVLDLKSLATDDSAWGQWFVGNFATALSPGLSTVYVDDVTISATLSASGP
jgi:hypothetical protein